MSSGEAMAEAARKYLGVPFEHTGRSHFGVDCIGLLVCVAHDLELTDYDNRNYSRVVNTDFLRTEIEKFCDLVPNSDVRVGDVLLFTVNGNPQHCGLVTQIEAGATSFIHAEETVGKVVETRLIMTWADRLERVYRWRTSP